MIETYCKAESAKDRDTWLSLFAPDATHEDPVGAPINRGIEAIGAFFDAGRLDRWTSTCTRPRTRSWSATKRSRSSRCTWATAPERLVLSPIVDHLMFDDDGRITALRAFFDPAGIRPDPE